MSEEKKPPIKKVPIKEGYQPNKKIEKGGYQPNRGNLDPSNPPKGGSGVPKKSQDNEKTNKKE